MSATTLTARPAWRRAWRGVSLALRVGIPAAVFALVWRELVSLDWPAVWAAVMTSDRVLIVGAMGAAALAVAVMGLYDVLAFRDIGRLTGLKRWGLGSMLFAWTNFLTLGPLGGPAARLIIYRKAGASTGSVVVGLTRLYIGMLSGLAGWLIAVVAPITLEFDSIPARAGIAVISAIASAMVAGRLLALIPPGRVDLGPARSALLGLVGTLDWGGVLAVFVLTGAAAGNGVSQVEQARAMYLGHLAGMLSMIPGGLGSADAVWLKTLTLDGASAETTAAQIMLFRVIYYILPWMIAALALNIIFAEQWKRLLAERMRQRRSEVAP